MERHQFSPMKGKDAFFENMEEIMIPKIIHFCRFGGMNFRQHQEIYKDMEEESP